MLALRLSAALVAALACPSIAATAPANPPQRPNVVLIMVDDMGWTDLGCQGNEAVDTPNLDRLAKAGVRLTNAYAAAPVCSPTRAAILTGLAPARLRITNHIPDQKRFTPKHALLGSAPMRNHLPKGQTTLADRLRSEGYATTFIGKWHLAGKRQGKQGLGNTEFYPEKHGFDGNIGGCAYGGPPTFFDPYRIHNLPSRREGEYLPDRLADESIRFLRNNRKRPFFLCLWPYAVHWPMEAPARLVAKYEKRKGKGVKDPRYAAMTEALDTALGRIFNELDELGLANDTLVIFTSDNGPYLGVAEPKPLRSGKGHLYEGGIRVPMIVRWPGVVPAGRVAETPVISMDVVPTVLRAAGLDAREARDGIDLLPMLRGETAPRRSLFWHYPNYAFHGDNRLGAAIRSGDHKLIQWFDDGSVELYDLARDIGETRNLAESKPELAQRLRSELDAWLRETGANMPVPDFANLALRSLAGPDRAPAQRTLARAIERDWPAAHAVWARTKDERRKTCLSHMLQLPTVAAAETVVRGKLVRVETIQGGVVDYRYLIAHFQDVEILRAPKDTRRELRESKSLKIAAGTSHDAWLFETLRRDLERVREKQTWTLRPRELRYGDAAAERAVRVFEYRTLPAAAFPLLRR